MSDSDIDMIEALKDSIEKLASSEQLQREALRSLESELARQRKALHYLQGDRPGAGGVTELREKVLTMLAHRGAMRFSDIREELHVSMNALTYAVESLIKNCSVEKVGKGKGFVVKLLVG